MLIVCERIPGPRGGELLGFYGFVPPGPEHPTELHHAWLCAQIPAYRAEAERRGIVTAEIPAGSQGHLEWMAGAGREELEDVVTDVGRDVRVRLLAHEFLLSRYDEDELEVHKAWQESRLASIDGAETRRLMAQLN